MHFYCQFVFCGWHSANKIGRCCHGEDWWKGNDVVTRYSRAKTKVFSQRYECLQKMVGVPVVCDGGSSDGLERQIRTLQPVHAARGRAWTEAR
jgi:DhnA family fructose-bisphosphate aldolase class Ia